MFSSSLNPHGGRRILTAVGVGSACLGLAAWGGGESVAGTADSSGPAAVKLEGPPRAFEDCMRKEGVEIPAAPPGHDTFIGSGSGPEDGVWERAPHAAGGECDRFLPAPPPGGADLPDELRDAMEERASCMRENGVDLPDLPAKGDRHEVRPLPESVDPGSREFQAAEKTCRGKLPEIAHGPVQFGGPGDSAGPSVLPAP